MTIDLAAAELSFGASLASVRGRELIAHLWLRQIATMWESD